MKLFVGIDPGKHGAVAVLDENGKFVSVYDTPIINPDKKKRGKKRSILNEDEMVNIMKHIRGLIINPFQILMCIENVHAMPRQGVSTMFNMGYGFGVWMGILRSLGFQIIKVEPRVWKANMKLSTGADKQASIKLTGKLYPTAPLIKSPRHRTASDGRAEAILIARYAWQAHGKL